jgi:hypothetical protein
MGEWICRLHPTGPWCSTLLGDESGFEWTISSSSTVEMILVW